MMRVPFNYLPRQFAAEDTEAILDDLRELARTGDFTLGRAVEAFEAKLADYLGSRHVIGVNSGTDALILALRGLGIGRGHKVVTQANTFIATVGAIVAVGAEPVLVDVDDRYQMDVGRACETTTRDGIAAVIPVSLYGMTRDPRILDYFFGCGMPVIEDACQALGAVRNSWKIGAEGTAGCFSFHPLKTFHVWGDGGAICTDNDDLAAWLHLYRNHGLRDRDTVDLFGVNSRLASIQAVVALRQLDKLDGWIARRRDIFARLDEGLADLEAITLPPMDDEEQEACTVYVVRAQRRDDLLAHLHAHGVEAKVHYPVPVHLQPAARSLGYQRGDFPNAERQAEEIITLPAHQYLTDDEVQYTIKTVRAFYGA